MRAGNVGMEGGRITSHSMSGRNYGLKRREPDDLVLDLQNVSLSPTKKLRVSESGVNAVAGPGSNFAAPQSGETPGSLLKALDLSGGPSLLPGQKRLSRVSSCSSLPRFSFTLDDQPMVEEIDDKSAQLAVIPWAPTTVIIPSDAKPVIEEVDDGPSDIPDVEEMADSESMEVVNDDIIVTEAESTTMGGQFGSPLPSFGAAPWQQCEILQPPFSKVMWSH